MTRNIPNLSKTETKLLTSLSASGKNVFTIEDAKAVLSSDRTRIRQALYILSEKGWLKQLEKGKYLIVPFEGIASGTWSEEAFVIASNLVDPYVISYWSALNHYGYTEQIPTTIFVATTKRKFKSETEVLGVPYKFITIKEHKFFGETTIWLSNKKVAITDKEKTIIDCLDHPEYCGGIVETAKGLSNAFEDLDLDKLTSYAEKMNNSAIIKRLGYLAEILGLPISNYVDDWQKLLSPGYSLLDPLSAKQGKFSSKWRIRVNVSNQDLRAWKAH